MTDEDFMREALHEAELTLNENEFPVGAIVVKGDEIIGRGRKNKHDFHLGHAEVMALRNVLEGKRYKREDELVIYTTVEPCAMCYGTILNVPIRKIVYAFEDPFGGGAHTPEHVLPVRHRGTKYPQVVSGVLREESKKLLKQFISTTQDPFWNSHPDNPLIKKILE